MLVQNLVSLHSYISGRVSTWSCFVCFSFSVFLDSSCWDFTWIFIWNTWVLWSSHFLFCVRIFRFCHPCYTDTMNNGKVSLFYMSRWRINGNQMSFNATVRFPKGLMDWLCTLYQALCMVTWRCRNEWDCLCLQESYFLMKGLNMSATCYIKDNKLLQWTNAGNTMTKPKKKNSFMKNSVLFSTNIDIIMRIKDKSPNWYFRISVPRTCW